MIFRNAAFVAAIFVAFLLAPARAHHPVSVIASPIVKGFGISSSAGAAFVGGGQAVLAVAIVWCANNQPKRNMRKDIWIDGRHDVYPTHNPRKRGCVVKGKEDPKVKPQKLWPDGK